MKLAPAICGAALLASAPAAAADGAAQPPLSSAVAAKAAALRLGQARSSFRIDYTDYSKLYGDRTVLTADSKLGGRGPTRFLFSVSEGQRRTSESRVRATRGEVAVDHDWSDRLSSHTAVRIATNGSVFAKTQIGQDISYELGHGLVGSVGAHHSSYGNGNAVTDWSAGGAYYLPGAMVSYRYSLYDSSHFGRSHAHLASFRLNDPRGGGSTRLWVAHGTSLYEAELAGNPTGRFTSLAVQRSQAIGSGISLDVGLNHAWYRTPRSAYRGTGVTTGLSFSGWPL